MSVSEPVRALHERASAVLQWGKWGSSLSVVLRLGLNLNVESRPKRTGLLPRTCGSPTQSVSDVSPLLFHIPGGLR